MKYRNPFSLIAVIIVLVASMAAQNTLPPSPGCENMLVGHRYAYTFQGFMDIGLPALAPNAGGGYIQFINSNRFAANVSLSVGGVSIPLQMKGSYQMHLDMRTGPALCRGTAVFDNGSTLQLVASPNGTLQQMHIDQGLVMPMDSFLMEAGKCSNATLNGNYIYSAMGFFAPPDYPQSFGTYTPFSFSGALHFDGKGNLTGWDTVSLSGNIVPRTYAGTYKLNSDCTATSVFKDTLGNQVHTMMFIYQSANAVAVINTDAGTVLAFNATRQ